jgi:hypothetical protein
VSDDEKQELVLMVDVFCACIETGVLPLQNSPCHKLARKLVDKSGMKPKRKRTMSERSERMEVASNALFDKCVRRRRNGRTIRCRLGLWRVDATTVEQAEREARHYWVQYHADGEYRSLLSNMKLSNRPSAGGWKLGH